MSTSLSRQLDQLRAAAPPSAAPGASVSSLGPNILDDASEGIPEAKLRVLAERAFPECVNKCPRLKHFKEAIFEEQSDQETDVSEALLLLSPMLLTPGAQFVLQFLLTRHKLHASHPERLLFAALPHYTTMLFHRLVDKALVSTPVASDYPKWVEAFRTGCHPATKVGLYKHVAVDKGFVRMICDMMVDAHRHQTKHEGSSYDGITFFFATLVLGALSASPNALGEQNTHSLLQVIVPCLKSKHKEFRALGATLMARLFPLVKLKAKVANHVLKTLRKSSKGREDRTALALLLILIKTQKKTVDKAKCVSALVKLNSPLSSILEKEEKTRDDVEYIGKITDTLSMLCEGNSIFSADSEASVEDCNTLLKYLQQCLEAAQPSLPTVSSLRESLTLAAAHFKRAKKKANTEDKPEAKSAAKLSRHLLGMLKMFNPELFSDSKTILPKDNDDDEAEQKMEVDETPSAIKEEKKDEEKKPDPMLQELSSLKELKASLEENKDAVKKFISYKSEDLSRVLAALISKHHKVQKCAFKILDACVAKGTGAQTFLPLIKHLVATKEEIVAHPENVAKVMESFSGEKGSSAATGALMNLAVASEKGDFARMAPFFSCLKAKSDCVALASFASDLLKIEEDEEAVKDNEAALVAVLLHFIPALLSHLEDKTVWKFLSAALHSKVTVKVDRVSTPAAVLVLNAMTDFKFSDGPKMFSVLIDLSSLVGVHGNVLLGCRNVIAGLDLTTEDFLDKLKSIWGEDFFGKAGRGRSGRGKAASRQDSTEDELSWQKTFFLVEMFVCRQKHSKVQMLLQPLFQLLKKTADTDEYYDNVYALDLLLSAIHLIIDNLKPEELSSLDETTVNPELLVHCIRNCSNPGTKNTALLILAKASACNADYVLQNSIQIFTFMGSHFLKVDSRHSFDVACQAIDIIVPHIARVCKAKGERALKDTCMNIVTTFVDASVDMPPHRFKTFMHKLAVCLGERNYLWIMVLLLLRATNKKKGSKMAGQQAERMRQIQDLYTAFPSRTQIEGLLQMMVNLKNDLPEMRKMLRIPLKDDKMDDDESLKPTDDYDMLRLKMLNFATTLLSSDAFTRQVAESLQQGEKIDHQLRLLIEVSIINIDAYVKVTRASKIHKFLVQHSEKVLESSLGILPGSGFISLLGELLGNEHDMVRRKALEVFNSKLQTDESLGEEESLPKLLTPLLSLAKGTVTIKDEEKEESDFNQQLALLSIRSFGRALGSRYPLKLKEVATQLAKKPFLKSLSNPSVKASTLLCLTELFHAIGPHAVVSLPPFINWLLDLMTGEKEALGEHAILLNSVILSVQKLMEHFSGFLNPYFGRFVVSTCELSALHAQVDVSSEGRRHMGSRVRHLEAAMATGIPTHSLISICKECFDDLRHAPDCVAALMSILKENVQGLDKAQALAISSPFMDFFVHAFLYRQGLSDNEDESDDDDEFDQEKKTNDVEGEIIQAFLALTLKLSLDDFKPLFFRVFNLLFDSSTGNDRSSTITAFHVTLEVAKRLKSLFDFSCETLVQKATAAISFYSANEFKTLEEDEESFMRMMRFLLQAMGTLFSYNQVESLLSKQYEEHVNALMTLFEAPLEDESDKEALLEQLSECVTSLAGSTEDETPWKYLNYHVLLNLRSSNPEVRMCVLNLVGKFLDKKGEGYMAVLPDAVPFIYETMEDEDSKIEVASKNLIRKMEEVFGTSVESYFE